MPAVERAAAAVTVLMVLVIAFKAADLTWRLLGDDAAEFHAPAAMPAAGAADTAEPNAPDYAFLQSLHLFGQPQTPAGSADGGPTESAELAELVSAPETNLQLTLRGVFQTGPVGVTVAIIADSRNQERPYRVGDELPGDAIIKRILPYSVLLERNGRLESLHLPRQGVAGGPAGGGGASAGVPGRAGRVSAEGRSQGGATPDDFGRVPRKLVADPSRLTRYVKFEPVSVDGRLKGYRVEPSGEDSLFVDAGLKRGDVVTGINGIALSSQDALSKLVAEMNSADHLLLDIENGRSRRKLDIRFD
jgi:general secretion pathway protein C